MPFNIDLDRGIKKRKSPRGEWIYMYKDTPGEFFTSDGNPVEPDVAKRAGFDVMKLQRERQKMKLKKDRLAEIDEQYARAEAEAEVLPLKIEHVAGPWFAVIDEQGKKISEKNLSHTDAVEFARGVLETMTAPAKAK